MTYFEELPDKLSSLLFTANDKYTVSMAAELLRMIKFFKNKDRRLYHSCKTKYESLKI